MSEWLRKLLEQARTLWQKWTPIQKAILGGIAGVAILAVVLVIAFSSAPAMVALIGTPITDDANLARIATKLDEEGVSYQIRPDGRLFVDDDRTARRMRAILIREDLIPPETDPWSLFDVDRFSITDFERNVNLRRAITRNLEQHLVALDDIDAASVTLVVPEKQLFSEEQESTTASIVITPKPGSDILADRRKVEGVQRLISFAVAGLMGENIVIVDHLGNQLNDFEGMAEFDRLELAQRQLRTKFDLEQSYKREVLQSLARIFTRDRVQIIKLDIDLDYTQQRTETEEHFPITRVADNPLTPFDETEVDPFVTLSRQTSNESFEGTGFNPEGPPGQEGQTPPAYRDLTNLVGTYSRNTLTENNAINRRSIVEESSPWAFRRITVSVAIDGAWRRLHDERGRLLFEPDGSTQREYTPVGPDELAAAERLLVDAIGFDARRGDSVTVEHLQFDRTEQFRDEDGVFRRQAQVRRTLFFLIILVTAILAGLLLYRYVARQVERRRRLREEELAREHQAMREAALRAAEKEGPEVDLSIEDRAKLELQEQAAALAREHPEDVAQLLRTWLVEE